MRLDSQTKFTVGLKIKSLVSVSSTPRRTDDPFMNSAIFMVTLAVAGTFFTGLLSFLIVPHSASRKADLRRASQDDAPVEGFYVEPEGSKEKRLFGDALAKAVGDASIVFAEVSVAKVLAPEDGQMRWRKTFKRISNMNFDFVVSPSDGSAKKFAIQLEDASPKSRGQLKRDQHLADACESSGLPLVRIRAARGYAIGHIREQLAAAGVRYSETSA